MPNANRQHAASTAVESTGTADPMDRVDHRLMRSARHSVRDAGMAAGRLKARYWYQYVTHRDEFELDMDVDTNVEGEQS
jgi:hypothetical protein